MTKTKTVHNITTLPKRTKKTLNRVNLAQAAMVLLAAASVAVHVHDARQKNQNEQD